LPQSQENRNERKTRDKEGIEIGKGIGREEGLENIVVKSFKNGTSLEFISSITDLSIEVITSILQKNKLM
jgi:hypothetical protein